MPQATQGGQDTTMIEATNSTATYVYRLDLSEPSVIQRKENKLGGRWEKYASYLTPEIARANLLKLSRLITEEGE